MSGKQESRYKTTIIAAGDDFYIGCRELKDRCGVVSIVFPTKTIAFNKMKMHYSDHQKSFAISEAFSTAIFYTANIRNINPFLVAIKLRVEPQFKLQSYLTFLVFGGYTYVMLNRTNEVVNCVLSDISYKGIDMSDIYMLPEMKQSLESEDSSDSEDSEQIVSFSQPVAIPAVADSSDSEQTVPFSQPVVAAPAVAIPEQESGETVPEPEFDIYSDIDIEWLAALYEWEHDE